jgi:fumarate hydratase subunit beta
MIRPVQLPMDADVTESLHVGDEVELNGTVYTGRDQACARMSALLSDRRPLPIDPTRQLIYFVGPSPAPPGCVVGAAGPTTSGRMNRFIPRLMAEGFCGFIGKGHLSEAAKEAVVRYRGVYFGAIGGTGALLAQSIREMKVVAFEELLSEAMHSMRIERFPVVVLNDCHGGDLYAEAKKGGPLRHEDQAR